MKKLFSIIAVAALSTAFVACGPSKEEIAAKEKITADSIAKIEEAAKAREAFENDSLAKIQEAANKAREAFVTDSTAAASKGGKKGK